MYPIFHFVMSIVPITKGYVTHVDQGKSVIRMFMARVRLDLPKHDRSV